METPTTKRQVSEVIYGKTAKPAAEQRKHELFEWNDNPTQGNHEIATPWADWSVEETRGGYAVFVTETE